MYFYFFYNPVRPNTNQKPLATQTKGPRLGLNDVLCCEIVAAKVSIPTLLPES